MLTIFTLKVLGMNLVEFIGSILLFISSVILVVIVLAQQGRSAYLGGAIAGGAAESFLGKNKGRSANGMLVKITRIFAIAFFVLTVAVNFVIYFLKL